MHSTTTTGRARLTLPGELYLLGHDDDTGQPHIHTAALSVGLAGAVLIDLYLDGAITLTNSTDPDQGQRITLATTTPHHPDIVTARTLYTATVTPTLKPWLRGFATGLHEHTRDQLVTTGVLHATTRRRLGGLLRAQTHLPTHHRWPVLARARVRYLATGHERPDNHSAALAGLVTALGLEHHLYLGLDTRDIRTRLRTVTTGHYPAVRDILTAVDATIGDLATATYR